MPIKPGNDPKTVSTNISEFHTGKTYSHTLKKFGKAKADAQAIAVALSTARKYAKGGASIKKYADAGAVDSPKPLPPIYVNSEEEEKPPTGVVDDSWKDREALSNLAAQDHNNKPSTPWLPTWRNFVDKWWYAGQPTHGADEYGGLPEASMTEDFVNKMIKGAWENAQTPGKAYQEGLTPEEETSFGAGTALGQIGRGLVMQPKGIGIGGGKGGYTKDITPDKIPDLHQAVMDAAYAPASQHPQATKTAKDLKAIFPKDLATSAFYLGLDPEQMLMLQTHMTPGAKEAFINHYDKLAKSPAKQIPIKEEKQPVGISSQQFHQDAWHQDPGGTWHGYDDLHNQFASQPLDLFKAEKQAVAYWGSAEGYKDINGHLRGAPATESATKAISNLDTAMIANQTKSPMSVWRGLHGPQAAELQKLQVGDTFHNKGYTATTLDPRRATHYGAKDNTSNILLNYHLPEGTPSLYVSHPDAGNWIQAERELLLPHGGGYKVTGTEKISAPVWHYMGDLKDPNLREYTVYHVEPVKWENEKGVQLDKIASPAATAKEAAADYATKAIKALEEALHNADKEQDPFHQEPLQPEGWGQDLYKPEETFPGEPHIAGKPLEEAMGQALQDKYQSGGWEFIYPLKEAELKSNFDSIKHNLYDVSSKKLISTLASTHADGSPISKHSIYGDQLSKYLDKKDTGTFLSKLSEFSLSPKEMKNVLSYFSDAKIDEIKSHLNQELNQNGHFVPKPADAASSFGDTVDQHVKHIDWKDYKPKQADPTPEVLKKNRKAIIAAGGNPDVALLKGGEHHPSGYPDELMDATQKGYGASKTKGLFLGDEKAVASQYGYVNPPYVAVPKNKVAEVDFHALSQALGQLESHTKYGKVATAYNPNFVKAIKHVREKYDPEMLVMHNVYDWASPEHKPQTQYIVFKTNILRAPTAKFDPTKWHLRVPLAGIAGLGLGAGAGIYSYGDEKTEHFAQGGNVKKRHEQIDENPQDHEFIDFSRGGLIDSDIPGRTDKIPMKVAAGAYVLPADIPSALGQGNSKAGSEILKKMFTHSAYGLPPPKIPSKEFHYPHHLNMHFSKGKAEGGETDHVPIIAAGGEFIIHPDVVKHVGEGNMKQGHKLLDKFVLHTRKEHINTLRKLKPPK